MDRIQASIGKVSGVQVRLAQGIKSILETERTKDFKVISLPKKLVCIET